VGLYAGAEGRGGKALFYGAGREFAKESAVEGAGVGLGFHVGGW